MDNLFKYFSDTAAELKQVSWPTQKQAALYTALVIAISLIVAMFVGAFDYAFSQFIGAIVNRI
jgi:preprotein translocase subunit SecE